MKSTILTCAILMGALTAAWAQHGPSPYAGQESRQIKSLSPAETSELLNGDGMGLAKAAELNGYPGPKHVLDLAEPLKLTSIQVAATEATYRRMNSRAKKIGGQIIEREQALDALFAGGAVTSEALSRSVAKISALQGELRTLHLDAHLSQLAILTPEQVSQYRRLRGYDSPGGEHMHSH